MLETMFGLDYVNAAFALLNVQNDKVVLVMRRKMMQIMVGSRLLAWDPVGIADPAVNRMTHSGKMVSTFHLTFHLDRKQMEQGEFDTMVLKLLTVVPREYLINAAEYFLWT